LSSAADALHHRCQLGSGTQTLVQNAVKRHDDSFVIMIPDQAFQRGLQRVDRATGRVVRDAAQECSGRKPPSSPTVAALPHVEGFPGWNRHSQLLQCRDTGQRGSGTSCLNGFGIGIALGQTTSVDLDQVAGLDCGIDLTTCHTGLTQILA
jgi:hypothetical protein